ncbi:hypothetical protein GOBAR_AA33480 [Gossypium barbadense]|uniref:Uncharacterized protein n=1 Tax=Gossypium barbadense TaxID=3634 RepID=A0A2P5W809_GOSBA|nr:hypothetical protein GOBAR_AA33480 [Gossypium barbadense]
MGLSESLGDNSRDHGVKGREKEKSVQDREYTFVSEFELAMRPGSKNQRRGNVRKMKKLICLSLKNQTLEEEQLSGRRVEPKLEEKDKSGNSNWAMEDVSNIGFSVVELGLENIERAQDEHREIEEGVGLVVDLGL